MKIEKTMLIGELIHMDELIPQMLMGDLVSKMNEILADR